MKTLALLLILPAMAHAQAGWSVANDAVPDKQDAEFLRLNPGLVKMGYHIYGTKRQPLLETLQRAQTAVEIVKAQIEALTHKDNPLYAVEMTWVKESTEMIETEIKKEQARIAAQKTQP